MRILVTGGAGYIGSVTAAQLVALGHDVTVLDDLSLGHREAVGSGIGLEVGDVGDAGLLDRVFGEGRFDAVMHFAAYARVAESMQQPEIYFRNNVAVTLTLLEAMLAHGVRRFVFSSTAAVYGDPREIPIREDATVQPTNPYGESKLSTERMMDWFSRLHGFGCASLRYFNAAGATRDLGEDHATETHLIPLVLAAAVGKRPNVAIFGTDYPTPDGTCIRDYIHVLDLADAHVRVLDVLNEGRRLVYNLGNGSGFSVREVIRTAAEVTGRDVPYVEADRRPGDPPVLVASADRINKELGWKPLYPSLEQIIASAWEWHCRYPAGYGDSAH